MVVTVNEDAGQTTRKIKGEICEFAKGVLTRNAMGVLLRRNRK